MKSAVLAILLCASLSSGFLFRTKQRVIVRGRLFCGDEPAGNVLVKLVDEDTGTVMWTLDFGRLQLST